MVPKICSVEGCSTYETARVRRGMCRAHYDRWIRQTPKSDRMWPTVEERFWSKVDKSGDCWLWTGTKRDGYGSFVLDGKAPGSHRIAWEWLVGPISEGLFLDHMCHNRACVNPSHLQIATSQMNNENLSGPQKNSTTGVRGVSKIRNKWTAKVKHAGTSFHLGLFETLHEAEVAAIAKRNELFTNNLLDRRRTSELDIRPALDNR